MASEQPIEQPFFQDDSKLVDVVFEVEGLRINFSKALLMVSSPVFEHMFSENSKKQQKKNIPLVGKNYHEFVTFLKQLHPALSWTPVKVENLEPLLKFSAEYDVSHVKDRCVELIQNQITDKNLAKRQILTYLKLSEDYKLTTLREKLIEKAADYSIEELEGNEYFQPLEDATKFQLAKKRCQFLEEDNQCVVEAPGPPAKAIRKA